MKVTKQDLEQCVAFLLQCDIMAYHHNGKVFVDVENDTSSLSLEISKDNILHLSRLYDEGKLAN
ncbi:hypothetical protein LS74_000320 [Helicobacter magdeburgensis]|uniref:Uncharacterized protein n=2 Tax=Helicobacter TaxID=209 RepID=A0A4U8T329_9HELI|nr:MULTISPECIES: hypothetical protein [Helicobacter]EFR45889.1 hypothetical protein HCCG_00435 [Helicobacter cinaedi CCUG 18818 = ATCC BAA-847]QOQ90848.1 hypothetical protein HW260_00290 [Helicobacter cinaedi]TLD93831.1 hypothetical protein LS74_000320 [Helicobacter magdeburgensis]BAM33249.1 hypothetical protein HCBAA847_2031 [Helicobacter cinaedi CCUG 18818 = ATCC BAA-847]BDB66055.1 hypothetical protein Hc94105_0240 [Helicobacter cinaedi]